MAKSSQISTTNHQKHNNTSTSDAITPKTVKKSILYTLSHRIHTITTDKNLKPRLKELCTALNKRGYPTILLNKGFELRNPKKHNNEKPIVYVATYNKNNSELFTEIMKNLKLKNNDKIKQKLGTTKIIKSQR